MKIAYLLGTSISGKSNGVRMQAVTWGAGLQQLGHKVVYISPWGHYNWDSFDIIHIFGYGAWLEIVPIIAKRTKAKIVLSPIIDTNRNHLLQKLGSYCSIPFLRMHSPINNLRRFSKDISCFYARSNHEMTYLTRSFNIKEGDIKIIPLSCRIVGDFNIDLKVKENFCFHVSILSGPHKNVKRLITAAIQYNFQLVLAGNAGSESFHQEILEMIHNHHNVNFLGFVDDNQLIDLYRRAKVFALPSIFEGVGLVALEAATYGCDIVITNRGGPKEYHANLAHLVNPLDINEIGTAISDALAGKTFQPQLSKHIRKKYNRTKLIKELERSYLSIVNNTY